MVVGDDDQSLYRFCGATIELFRDFSQRVTAELGCCAPALVCLEENYHSPSQIVEFFSGHIQNDPDFAPARVQLPLPFQRQVISTAGPAEIGVIGMFRQDPATLAADLAEFLRRTFRGHFGVNAERPPRGVGWPGQMCFRAGVRSLAGDLMWTPTTRTQHSRADLRYGSDLTDAEWLILFAFLPAPSPCGRHRKWEMREIVNAIFYVLRGGIAWSMLPKEFPPWSTAYRWFARFRDDGTWERINHHAEWLILFACRHQAHAGGIVSGRCGRSSTLSSTACAAALPGACCRRSFRPGPRPAAGLPGSATTAPGSGSTITGDADRERVGREASPTAAVIDSQPDGCRDRQPERQDDRKRGHPRLRRRQEGQRPQAPRHSGHGWSGAQAPGPFCRYPGSRRGRAAAADLAPKLALCGIGLCRRWLRRSAGRRGKPHPHRGGAQG